MFEIVADCSGCEAGKVPFDPPNTTECDACGAAFICHPGGKMEPLDGDLEPL